MSSSLQEAAKISESTPYDRVPYKSYPFSQTHPDRLATIGILLGMTPTDVTGARVLELGCASGGNLIPMAEQYPDAHFVGIDYAGRQVEEGQEALADLGLTNIEIHHQDILEFPTEGEPFDYIICHGVYSWVPDEVQRRILEISKSRLSTNGLAYISYNTYPGWHMRGMIRDIMRYRARNFDTPESQLSQARGLLTFLSNSVSTKDNAYGILLKNELESIGRSDDSYLLHEHLEEINEPIYFHQFAERASDAGLQYLGEADYQMMSLDNFPDHVRGMLESVSRDVIETEQYMDFLRNRGFRQTILCHDNVQLNRKVRPEAIVKLRVASSTRPETDHIVIRSPDKTSYRRGSSTLTTNDPVVKAAMMHLQNAWPESIPYPVLAAQALSTATGRTVGVDTEIVGRQSHDLASMLLRCYGTGQVDLHTSESSFGKEIAERPRVTGFARRQSTKSPQVTNGLHQRVSLDDLQRHVLRLLDGTRTLDDVEREIIQVVKDGQLLLHLDGNPVTDDDALRTVLAQSVPDAVKVLAGRGLLVREE